MGLDMYAYTLRKELADTNAAGQDTSNWLTDFPVQREARRAVGFIDLPDGEVDKLSPDDQRDYYAKQRTASDLSVEEGHYNNEFAYWRKFNALHGWMQDLYERKGGTDPAFNCNTVRLMPEDIDELEQAAQNKLLAPVPGFFFGGQDEFSDDDRDDVLAFCAKCRVAFDEGNAVFYDSWW